MRSAGGAVLAALGALGALVTLFAGCRPDRGEVRSRARPSAEAARELAPSAAIEPAAQPALPAAAIGKVRIPAGTFTMRDTVLRRQQPVVVHAPAKVEVEAFELDATEVTAGAYAACVAGKQCAAPPSAHLEAPDCNLGRPGRELHPMNCVTWDEADAYCASRHERLPTEREWEYAARGGERSFAYPWGNAEPTDQLCWSSGRDRDGTCRVASFPPEALGVYDLAGDVEEWTSTEEPPEIDGVPYDGPPKRWRVARGGSWATNAAHAVLGHSVQWTAYHSILVGFRCAR